MNENSFNNFKKYIKYDILNNYANLKHNFVKDNINEFNEIFYLIKDKVKFSELIQNYEDCTENLKKENKFFIIKNNHIRKINKIEEIKYFTYKSNNYIFFKENKKIYEIKNINDEHWIYWILIEYNPPKEINKDELIKIFKNKIDMNKKEDNLKKYINISKYEDIKDFYLIEEDVINKIILKNNNEIFSSPNISKIPEHFGIIEKSQENEFTITKINIQKNLVQYKILFVDEYKKLNNSNLYIGIINTKSFNINFYLVQKQQYSLEYAINYDSKDKMVDDIENNIIPNGLAAYIYETGINFSYKKTNKLFNKELELIGYITNYNNKNEYLKKYANNLETFENSHYYTSLIQCLVNIKPLKDLFCNRELLLNEKIVQDYKKVTKSFYKIMQYLWDFNNNEKEKLLYFNLFIEIPELSKINNIYDKLDLLIVFLLYAMHVEQNINDEKIKINYNLNSLKSNIKDNQNSFIKNIFPYKSENQCKSCKNTINQENFILYLNIKKLIQKNPNTKDINIYTLLRQEKYITCNNDNCTKRINSDKIKIITCPNILLIYFQEINVPNINFNLNEVIDIKDIIIKNNEDKKTKYKLIGLLIEYNENNRKNVISYSKSPVNNIWYEYKNGKCDIKGTTFDYIEKKNNCKVPNFLIYERILK